MAEILFFYFSKERKKDESEDDERVGNYPSYEWIEKRRYCSFLSRFISHSSSLAVVVFASGRCSFARKLWSLQK